MKKILFSLVFMAITAMGFSQGGGACPTITGGLVVGPVVVNGTYNYTVTLAYDANGTKNFRVFFNCGTVNAFDSCVEIQGTGTVTFPVSTTCLVTQVVITSGTGTCNNSNGNSCSQEPPIVAPPGGPIGGPLPIVIDNFFAKRSNSTVHLTWTTSQEINAKEFIVQKNSGSGFVDVQTIAATNSPSGDSYVATDVNMTKSTTFYRLKMVDFDGSFRNSDTRTVKGIGTAADYTVFPNPVEGSAKISITDIAEPTDVQIIDNAGRVIRRVTLINNNSIELNGLQNGMYQLRIKARSENTVVTRKLSVVN